MKKKNLVLLLLPMLIIGCGGDSYSTQDRRGSITNSSNSSNGSTSGSNTTLLASGTYNDVHTVLQNSGCVSCHSWASDPVQVKSRVNTTSPADSLLLQKATATIAHSGGQRFTNTSNEYFLLTKWIEAGAPIDGSSFDVGGLSAPTIQPRPGYDTPTTTTLKSFTRPHYNGSIVQGQACITCHQNEEGRDFVRFGGTLFSYIHTPNGKYYQDLSGYNINIVGNSGTTMTAIAQANTGTGLNNFDVLSENGSFNSGELFTVYIKNSSGTVVNQSGENTHNSNTHRDCNKCHTEQGLNNAPGRVLVPLVN